MEATDGRDLSPNIAPLPPSASTSSTTTSSSPTARAARRTRVSRGVRAGRCPGTRSGRQVWLGIRCGPTGLAGNPLSATGLAGNPLWATGLAGNPLWATGLAGNPFWATGLAGNPLWATVAGTFAGAGGRGYRSNAGTTAAPVVGPELQRLVARPGAAPTTLAFSLRVVVLDSGLADPASGRCPHGWAKPSWDRRRVGRDAGDPNQDTADEDNDDRLDRVDGHGTFIAGVIGKLVPGATVDVVRLFGRQRHRGRVEPPRPTDRGLRAVTPAPPGRAVAEWVQRATGGSRAGRRDPRRRSRAARWSWLPPGTTRRACPRSRRPCPAWSVSAASVLADRYRSATTGRGYGPGAGGGSGEHVLRRAPRTNSALSDLDDFKGWARWSGTSFAAPAVAAALLRELLGMGEVAAARPTVGRSPQWRGWSTSLPSSVCRASAPSSTSRSRRTVAAPRHPAKPDSLVFGLQAPGLHLVGGGPVMFMTRRRSRPRRAVVHRGTAPAPEP